MKSFTIFCLVATTLAAPAAQAANGTAAACAQSQSSLEKGIQANLDIQAQELKGYVCTEKSSDNATKPDVQSLT